MPEPAPSPAAVPTAPMPGATPPVDAKPSEPAKPAAEPAKVPEPEVASSNRFAALRRQERKLREKAAEVAKAEVAAKLAREEVEATRAKLAKSKEDPLEALAAMGLTYDQVTQAILARKDGAPAPTPADAEVRRVREELAELRAAREADAKARAAAEAAQQAQTLASYQAQVTREVQALPEFELVNLSQAHGMVWMEIQNHYNTTGEVLPTAEAAKKVEAELEAQFRRVLTASKKLATIGTANTTPAPVAPSGTTEAPKPAPTLSAGLISTQPPSQGEMSEAARTKRAIDAYLALKQK